jgi:hypothetical protein
MLMPATTAIVVRVGGFGMGALIVRDPTLDAID